MGLELESIAACGIAPTTQEIEAGVASRSLE